MGEDHRIEVHAGALPVAAHFHTALREVHELAGWRVDMVNVIGRFTPSAYEAAAMDGED